MTTSYVTKVRKLLEAAEAAAVSEGGWHNSYSLNHNQSNITEVDADFIALARPDLIIELINAALREKEKYVESLSHLAEQINYEIVINKEQKIDTALLKKIYHISERDLSLVELKKRGWTLAKIGEKINRSPERVRQIIATTERRLKYNAEK